MTAEPKVTADEKLLIAAHEFCVAEKRLRLLRRNLRRCSKYSPDDYIDGGSSPACDLGGNDLCAECTIRVNQKSDYLLSLAARARAKRRMLKAASND